MKVMKGLLAISLAALVLLSISSCKKAREDVFVKGLWNLKKLYIDTIAQNQMETLPHWTEGNDCCLYRLDFQDNDVLFGYYLTHDTFSYISVGKWYLTDYDHVYMKVDSFADGIFEIKKPVPTLFKLECEDNYVKKYHGTALDTTYTRIEMEQD